MFAYAQLRLHIYKLWIIIALVYVLCVCVSLFVHYYTFNTKAITISIFFQ